jgi:hypothetical protein
VLYRDDWFGAGFRLRPSTELASPIGVGADAAYDWVRMRRSVVDHRGADPIVWVDEPKLIDRRFRAFLELAVVEIPFLVAADREGSLTGTAWKIDGDAIADPYGEGARLYDRMVRTGRFENIHELAGSAVSNAKVDFHHRNIRWRLILANMSFRGRDDRIELRDAEGRVFHREFQSERRRRFSWAILDNGETHDLTVRGLLGAPGEAGPIVTVHWSVTDSNAHSDEFDRYYRSLAGFAGDRPYLASDFSARDWEVSGEKKGRWTRLLVSGRVRLYAGALERLLETSPERHWKLLSQNLGMSHETLERQRRAMTVGPPKQRIRAARAAGVLVRSSVLGSGRALRALGRARRTEDREQRLTALVEALYQANDRVGGSYEPTVLATLLKQAGLDELAEQGELVVTGRITRSFDDENNLPERRDVLGQIGRVRDFDRVNYDFFPFDGIELYHMLDWVHETGAPADGSPIAP